MEETGLKIKIIMGHCLGGGKDVAAGTVLEAPKDLSVREARRKIAMNYAVLLEAIPMRTPDVKHRDPEATSRDPDEAVPAARTTRKKATRGKRK